MNLRQKFNRLTFWNKVAFFGAIASITAIPLSIALWYMSPNAENSEGSMSSQGKNSPVVIAGRDVAIGSFERTTKTDGPDRIQEEEALVPNGQDNGSKRPGEMSSTESNSPVVNAGRDVKIEIGEKKPDYVSNHDGAGALLLTESDFKAFLSAMISGKGEKILGRLLNGIELEKLELKEGNTEEPSPPWAKVKVLEGELEGSVGWILMNSLKKP